MVFKKSLKIILRHEKILRSFKNKIIYVFQKKFKILGTKKMIYFFFCQKKNPAEIKPFFLIIFLIFLRIFIRFILFFDFFSRHKRDIFKTLLRHKMNRFLKIINILMLLFIFLKILSYDSNFLCNK